MKIVKSGTTLDSFPRICTCSICFSEWEINKDDLKIGTYGKGAFYECGVCGLMNQVVVSEAFVEELSIERSFFKRLLKGRP